MIVKKIVADVAGVAAIVNATVGVNVRRLMKN
jgi:hypothetical protein